MLDGPTARGDQEVGDELAVAVGHAFLGAQQAERLEKVIQPADQQVPGASKSTR